MLNRPNWSHAGELATQVCVLWVSEPQSSACSSLVLAQQMLQQSECYEFLLPWRIVLMIPNSVIIRLLPGEFENVVYLPRGSIQGTSASVFGRRNNTSIFTEVVDASIGYIC